MAAPLSLTRRASKSPPHPGSWVDAPREDVESQGLGLVLAWIRTLDDALDQGVIRDGAREPSVVVSGRAYNHFMERINKFLAHAGLGSRRHCETLVLKGRVQVDGKPVTDLATKVEPGQVVTVDGRPIASEAFVYWAVHKPTGYLCTNRDPGGRPRAIDLVPQVPERVYTVGRLDDDSEGLLLLTNDGDLAHRLTHPRFGIEKTYHVQVAGLPTRDDQRKLLEGVWISDGLVKARRVHRLKTQGKSTWLEVVLAEGKNREIRRMLAKLDHKVVRLIRVGLGPLQLGRLKSGQARELTGREVNQLRRAAFAETDETSEE